jgi:myo-inositol 2-dehydrogenase / D-chiro-inositol 1-dehydrogenase
VRNVRIGLIGAGVMGRIHARCLSRHVDGGELIAVADLDREKAERCAEEFGAMDLYGDHESLLGDSSIDAVLACTPGNTHAEIIEGAAQAGKHIFCEKPIDWDLTAADRALDAVERAGVKLQIGFNRRFDSAFLEVRDAIKRGDLGRPHIVHLISRDPARPDAGAKAPGDLYFDSTIHDLDMIRFLTGSEVERVFSIGRATAVDEGGQGEDLDTSITLLRLRDGAIASIDNSRRSAVYDQRAEIFGPGGSVCVTNRPTDEGLAHDKLPFFAHRYLDAYIRELDAFVESVRNDSEPLVTGNDGRAALVLAIAAFRSYVEGRPVLVSEIG